MVVWMGTQISVVSSERLLSFTVTVSPNTHLYKSDLPDEQSFMPFRSTTQRRVARPDPGLGPTGSLRTPCRTTPNPRTRQKGLVPWRRRFHLSETGVREPRNLRVARDSPALGGPLKLGYFSGYVGLDGGE